jgi:hypothetical protein
VEQEDGAWRCPDCRPGGRNRLETAVSSPPKRAKPNTRRCKSCGDLTVTSQHWYCETCGDQARERRRKRLYSDQGPRPANRYPKEHTRARREWIPIVERGGVRCNLCGGPIEPGTPFHLSHPGDRKDLKPAPAHARCNVRYAAAVTAPRRRRERSL